MESPEDLEIQELLKTANLDMDNIDQEIADLEIDEDEPTQINTENENQELNIDKMTDKDVESLADDFIKIKDRQQLKVKQSELLIQIIKAINFDVNTADDIAKLTFDRDFLKDPSIQKNNSIYSRTKNLLQFGILNISQNAQDKQKNLGINILRQILKCNYLKMTPKFPMDMTKLQVKKVSRIYLIQKILYLRLFNFHHPCFIKFI